MNPVVNCPTCGKRLAYDSASAGQLWLCPACGSMLRLPAPPPPTAPPEPVAAAPAAQEDDFRGNPLSPWLIVLLAIVVIQAIVLVLQTIPMRLTWEQLHRQDVFDLKATAEGEMARGHLQQAYQRFRDLDTLVAGNPINDPTIKSALQTSADEENTVFTRMIRESQIAAATKAAHSPSIHPSSPPTVRTSQLFQAPAIAAAPPPPPAPRRPNVHPLPPPASSGVDDQQIGRNIEGGVQYLLDRFDQYRISVSGDYPSDDADALAIYALLQAYHADGDSRLDPRRNFMKQCLDALKRLDINDRYATYGRSLRANALELAERSEDTETLAADLRWLLATGPGGAYTYPMRMLVRTGEMTNWVWDNSNSQYGLLGVWAAAEAGQYVPKTYWTAAQNHWVSTQGPDGQWGYTQTDNTPRQSMTLAGLASLLVTQDYLHRDDSQAGESANAPLLADQGEASLNKAMAWLSSGDNGVAPFNEGFFPGYTAYGLERVGLASGYKYFGSHDWYRESAADIVNQAASDGGWGDPIRTSFALLFLARGRHPVLMNKLQFDGDWNAHRHDVANLTRYAARSLERQLNWQIVPINRDWADWTDCPILFISARQPPSLSNEEEQKLKQFILNGGLLLTQADGLGDSGQQDNPAVNKWAQDLGLRLFPECQWSEPALDHPLWTVHLRLATHPHLLAIGNGARLFMIHLPQDLSRLWQTNGRGEPVFSNGATTKAVENNDSLALGLNLFLYAVGRTDLRNRLVSSAIADTPNPPAASINMAQILVSGNNDPEPAAWPRFARWFRRQTDLGINMTTTMLENLSLQNAAIAHMTGVGSFTATDAQVAALRDYVSAGGIVLIDPCGGPNDFLKSARDDLLARAFPNAAWARLDENHPLLSNSGDGMSRLWPMDVREYVRDEPAMTGNGDAPMERNLRLLRAGKGCVILSPLDITSGLLGTHTWGIAGYTPDFSLGLAKNFVLWAWDGAKDN